MTVAAVLDRPTLVLNRDWTPIQTVTHRHAIGLVASGSASIIDPVTFEVHDLGSWDAVSRAQDRLLDAVRIRSQRLALAPPEVIVLSVYRGLGARGLVFSRRNIFRRDRFTCQYCGSRPEVSDLTIDHVLPRSRGGKSTWENCVLACSACNRLKADRTPREAGLELRRDAVKPAQSTFLRIEKRSGYESWKNFLSRAYWDVELEP